MYVLSVHSPNWLFSQYFFVEVLPYGGFFGSPGTVVPFLWHIRLVGCLGGSVGPGAEGLQKFLDTFCMGVGKILGLGGSKYRPPEWVGGRQAGTQKCLGSPGR